MKQWQTPQLSLAAYAIGQGAKLIDFDSKIFTLESKQTKSEVKISYLRSDESTFNSNLIELQKLRRG